MKRNHAGLVALAIITTTALWAGCSAKPSDNSQSPNNPGTFAANTGGQDEGTPKSGGKLNVGLTAETNSYNPYQGQFSAASYFVANAIFDPLTAIDPDGNVQPYLAKSFTSNTDFKQWTIGLRPNIKFHNGSPLDSAAVKANIDYGRKSGLTAQAFATITGVETPDPMTVVVSLDQPWSTFPLAFIGQPGYMAAPEMLADEKNGGRNPVGTGPFSFVSWETDKNLQVKKNKSYWREGLPYLDAIEFQVLTDGNSRLKSLESRSIDLMQAATPNLLLDLQERANSGSLKLVTDVGKETDETIIAFNTEVEPFNDPEVRRAIAMGVNQDELSETSYSGAFPAARGPFNETSPYYMSPEEAGYPAYDLAAAKQLAADYEKENGKQLSFNAIVPPDPAYLSIAQSLQQQGREAGIDIKLESVEQATLITTVLTGKYEATGFILFNSPTLERAYPFIATKPQPGLSLNFTRNDNPRITAAMNAARATGDKETQIEHYKDVQREMAKDLDKIFLVHNVSGIASALNVRGVTAATLPDSKVPAQAGSLLASPFAATIWLDR